MRIVRAARNEWLATNDRGAIVKVGSSGMPDAFSPGELLQVASAVCAGLSAEARLDHRLGEQAMEMTVSAERRDDENRYSAIDTVLTTDLSSLTPDDLDRLRARIDSAIDRACTVGRTLHAGAATSFRVESREGADQ